MIDELTAPEVAAYPDTFTTAWIAREATGLNASASGADVLVHGAGGGLGRLAIQSSPSAARA